MRTQYNINGEIAFDRDNRGYDFCLPTCLTEKEMEKYKFIFIHLNNYSTNKEIWTN
jgi:hypothetical protein